MSVSEVCWRSMREVVAEMAAQYYASVAGASNHINNNIINMKVSTENKEKLLELSTSNDFNLFSSSGHRARLQSSWISGSWRIRGHRYG